jgi:hypothetical protein
MKSALFAIVAIFSFYSWSYTDEQSRLIQARCLVEKETDKKLFSSDFRWGFPFADMLSHFEKIVASGKRLQRRVFFDQKTKSFRFPYEQSLGGNVQMPLAYADNIRQHIEIALQRNYADAIFFPDLGHSHFLIPEKKYKDKYESVPTEKMNQVYEGFVTDADLLIVYHTAEQLSTENDRYSQWRFYTRNLIGENKSQGKVFVLPALDTKGNAIGELPGYYWWGGGFNISASQEGCFPYDHRGKTLYFDLSLFDLAPEHSDDFSDSN